jgi:hypothetical protein
MGSAVSAIHASTSIVGDHWDTRFELYVGDFSITTGIFPKIFVTSNSRMFDLNYFEGTVLVMASATWTVPYNLEIHDTN